MITAAICEDITLSTGTVITHRAIGNGAQDAPVRGNEDAAMTEAERLLQ